MDAWFLIEIAGLALDSLLVFVQIPNLSVVLVIFAYLKCLAMAINSFKSK